jgi:uncharacterized protein (DUF1501 family)
VLVSVCREPCDRCDSMRGLYEAGKGARIALAGVDRGETTFEHPNAQDTYDSIWALKKTIGALTRQLAELIDPARSAPATIPAPPPLGPETEAPGE